MNRPHVSKREGVESPHPRIYLVDRVPPKPRLEPADRCEALPAIQLQRSVHVSRRDWDLCPSRAMVFQEHATRQSEPGLLFELRTHALVVVRWEFDITVEL